MVLVDTSLWVIHFREGNRNLQKLLMNGEVVCHPFIIGDLACGNLRKRYEILSLLQSLPTAVEIAHDEVLLFIENHHLMGQGLGYVDVPLMASAVLTGVPIWTLDKRLAEVSRRLGLNFEIEQEG
jgi:predicted nucleic acid-binding protein